MTLIKAYINTTKAFTVADMNSATNVPPHSDPLALLPVELCQEIFSWTVKREWGLQQDLVSTDRLPPEFDITALHIASVSRTWRDVALSTPDLWTTMAIYGPTTKAVKAVRLYLTRIGKISPFSLHLTQNEVFDEDETLLESVRNASEEVRNTKAIMELWFTHVQRWRSISFKISLGPLPAVLMLGAHELQNVQEVAVSCTWRYQSKRKIQKFWEDVYASRTLRAVEWGPALSRALILVAPFHRLTRFTIASIPLTELFMILGYCHRIEHLTVQELPNLGCELEEFEPIELLNLRVLAIESPCTINLPVLLEGIITPVLEELSVGTIPKMTSKYFLRDFLARSKCHLRRLYLNGMWDGEDMTNLEFAERDANSDEGGYLSELEKLKFGGIFDWTILKPRRDPSTGGFRVPFPALITLEAAPADEDGVVGKILFVRHLEGCGLWTYSFDSLDEPQYPQFENEPCFPKDEEAFAFLRKRSGLKVVRGHL